MPYKNKLKFFNTNQKFIERFRQSFHRHLKHCFFVVAQSNLRSPAISGKKTLRRLIVKDLVMTQGRLSAGKNNIISTEISG